MTTRTVLENGITAKGRTEYAKHVAGEHLSYKQRIAAMCYDCMAGYADGAADCKTPECPLYPQHPYNPNREKRKAGPNNGENLRRNSA